MASSPLQWTALLNSKVPLEVEVLESITFINRPTFIDSSRKKRVPKRRAYTPTSSFVIGPILYDMPIVEPSSPEDSDESDAIANDDANPASSSIKEKQKVSIKTEKDDGLDARSQLRRQRSESSVSTGNGRRKIRRISTAEAFAHLTDSVQRAIKSVTETTIQVASQLERPPTTPSTNPSVGAALSAIQENEGLSDGEFTDVTRAIVRNPKIGATYLAISRPNLRTIFLRRHLGKQMSARK